MPPSSDKQADRALVLWHSYLTGDVSHIDRMTKAVRGTFRHLPKDPRCRVCQSPFAGIGGLATRLIGFGAARSSLNPSLCGRCDVLVKRHQVGTEVELSLLFADVRGSSVLAEEIGAVAFHRQINRFYQAATKVLVESGALIEKLIGDEVAGMYVPGIAGPDHAQTAVESARALLAATGHSDPEGPWIKVGAGVHTGTAYVGAVGSSGGVSDITVLGDAANVAARLASLAGVGEILVSEEAAKAGGFELSEREARTLELKGRKQPVKVRVLHVSP
jgi:adenylate cyclase